MLRLDKVIKPWKESASLNDHINLYGFWNETAFLTKSGDLGMVLSVPGVDYESLDRSEQEYAVKRLEAALKAFGPGFHVYQYLFKSNRPDIPFATYDDPIVQAAIDQRRKFFEAKRDHLYQVEIFYCILLEVLSGMQPAEEFSTLVHEIAHEMLHRGDRRTLTTKQVRETEAEAVAFVVCQSVGLQNGTASQDYIQLWHGDANLLRESLEAVQQTAAVILGGIAPEPAALAAAA